MASQYEYGKRALRSGDRLRKSGKQQKVPLVSIVTPSYNKAEFIGETILSVRNQTYSRMEHIIIDGGSTDGTIDVIKKYEGTYDMHWVSEPDNGQSDAVNKGWRMAKGEILGWLNSDDTYMPWAVETAVKFLNDHPDVGMVYGDCNLINEHSKVTSRCQARKVALKEMLCRGNTLPQPAAFLRREVLDEVGYLDTNLHFAMDFDLWIRIGLEFKVEHISQFLANFRLCPGTKSMDEAYKFAPELLYILDKIFADPRLPEEIRALRRRAYSLVHFRFCADYLSQRQIKVARKHLVKAIRLYPRNLVDPWAAGYLVASFPGGRAIRTAVKPISRFF